MFTIIVWVVFGLIVGLLAKALHPGDEPVGFLPTVLIGVAGSFVGGGINWLLYVIRHQRFEEFHPSGFLMSTIGSIICCMLWRYYALKTSPTGAKNFFTGKNLK